MTAFWGLIQNYNNGQENAMKRAENLIRFTVIPAFGLFLRELLIIWGKPRHRPRPLK